MTRLSLIVAVVAALVVGCSAGAKTCGPSTCGGCCDSAGACQFGTSAQSCGGSGGACRACQGTEVCNAGLCLLPTPGAIDAGGTSSICNENNCAGCCSGDTCVMGKTVSACGRNGVVCAACTGNQQCNTSGRCQNATCLGCIDSAGSCLAGQSPTACGAQGYSCLACTSGATCNTSGACVGGTCDGCRDTQGVCRAGTSRAACGSAGNSCTACASTEQCTGAGACAAMPMPDAGPGSCDAANCPDGCCQGNSCVTRTTASQCGHGGTTCAACGSGRTCESGTCTVCTGCIDVNTGICSSGTTNTSCGKAGSFCQTCDTSSGQTCTRNVCQGGSCNASTCPTGCCDGPTCVRPADYTNFQCGSGTPGAACVTCNGTCDKLQGVCVAPPREDAGMPPSDGGLSIESCDPVSPKCSVGSCCVNILGAYSCVISGTDLIIFKACGSVTNCAHCSGSMSCNPQTYTCQ